MKMPITVFAALLAGCGPYTRMQSELVVVARDGLQRVESARQANAQAVRKSLDDQRRRLDLAFESDVRATEDLSREWVLTASRVYAAGIERHAAAVSAQTAADRIAADNAVAADESLQLLQRLLSAQQNLLPSLPRHQPETPR